MSLSGSIMSNMMIKIEIYLQCDLSDASDNVQNTCSWNSSPSDDYKAIQSNLTYTS